MIKKQINAIEFSFKKVSAWNNEKKLLKCFTGYECQFWRYHFTKIYHRIRHLPSIEMGCILSGQNPLFGHFIFLQFSQSVSQSDQSNSKLGQTPPNFSKLLQTPSKLFQTLSALVQTPSKHVQMRPNASKRVQTHLNAPNASKLVQIPTIQQSVWSI